MAAEGGVTVALDLQVSPGLQREGLARELVRLVQDARKAAGLDVTDRIELTLETADPVAEAVDEHRDWIAREVLAVRVDRGMADDRAGAFQDRREIDGHPVAIAIRRA